jgi:hypothetical protein
MVFKSHLESPPQLGNWWGLIKNLYSEGTMIVYYLYYPQMGKQN